MSGLAVLLNLDGAPVNPLVLQRLADQLTFRGPDAQAVWQSGPVGFAHSLLRTTDEAHWVQQPYSPDGQVWVVADARLDARTTLLSSLGLPASSLLDDVELLAQAYLRWGEDCPAHLLGDFAFVIWDGRQQKLVAARDQLGVRLLYYAQVANTVLISNTLNAIRSHPVVTNRLNEQAIGDFLLYGANYEPTTTFFADIQRLPAAHCLSIEPGGELRKRRYWQLPVPTMLRYKRPAQYIEHFQEVLGLAVADRLRTAKATVFLSGGLDSTSLAATALRVARQQNQPLDLRGLTVVFNRLFEDQEGSYATVAARALKLPLHLLPADDYALYPEIEAATANHRPVWTTPEPYHEPRSYFQAELYGRAAAHSRVVLYGEGGDEALYPSDAWQVLRGMPTHLALADLVTYTWRYRRRPPLGIKLVAQRLKRRLSVRFLDKDFPKWLNPTFRQRLALEQRWRELSNPVWNTTHPWRPDAYHRLVMPQWASVLEERDASFTGRALEFRLPFLDLRLLDYLLALPPFPWFINKELLRAAMYDSLPAEICRRPKTFMADDPFRCLVQAGSNPWAALTTMLELDDYIDRELLQKATNQPTSLSSWEVWVHMLPLTLGYWLQHYKSLKDTN